MDGTGARKIVIAGAGIAGLTAALAFAAKGFAVDLLEQAPELQDIGAGIQLSPNATRLLRRYRVLGAAARAATQPAAISIREARRLREIARIPLGPAAEERWRAPYLVVHRADLQSALVDRIGRESGIRLLTGARVRDAAFHARGVTVSYDHGGGIAEARCMLLVGADGVWSTVRGLGPGSESRPTGHIAWRGMVRREDEPGKVLAPMMRGNEVVTFVDPRFHLVAYPVRGGDAVNLVAVTRGRRDVTGWDGPADAATLSRTIDLPGSVPARLVESAGPWRAWPIHEIDPDGSWAGPGVVLIGDAAHAMSPFAAQGAAMAIEDAAALAAIVAENRADLPGALALYEKIRRPRIASVAARGRLNHFAWHAPWPVSAVRDLVLRAKGPEALAADLDWLYGYDAGRIANSE